MSATIPDVEPGWATPYLEWLRAAGVRFTIAPSLLRPPDHDGPLLDPSGQSVRRWAHHVARPFDEHREPGRHLGADHATESVLEALQREPIAPGSSVWDIGCGTGVLAVAAGLAGGRVVATDIHAACLALARRTAESAGVAIDLRLGPLLDPLRPDETADLVLANLPHKPVPAETSLALSQNGGPDGDLVHRQLVAQIRTRLRPGSRVLFFLHSLPVPALLRDYEQVARLELVSLKRRRLAEGEYGPLQDLFMERAAAGLAWMGQDEGGRFLAAGVWRAIWR
jgi:2-polyprenyl-3-methyl-5-hydroxy-6-metoxy-1,4-benzoquinol methylase